MTYSTKIKPLHCTQDKSLFKDKPSNFQHVAKVAIASGKFNVCPLPCANRPLH